MAISMADPANDNSRSQWGGRIEMGAYGNTAEASAPSTMGNITVMTSHINNTLLPWASVDLYQGGKLIQSGNSSANGTVQFKTVPAGTYFVNTTRGRFYGSNTSTVTAISKTSINLNLSLMYFDLNMMAGSIYST